MPKGIDPKAYAARITKVKKLLEEVDPITKSEISKYIKSPKQGTQSGHAVTDNNNHTKTVPSSKMPDNKTKPMSKDDKAARAKYGEDTWNNGYTN